MSSHSDASADPIERARALVTPGERHLLGIVGPPGSGKSTLAEQVRTGLGDDAVVVPMDGFHLANEVLADLGLTLRKGAPDTFDAAGFVTLLRRLRSPEESVVYAPQFRRAIEEAISSAIPVPRRTPLVVVEGNYLLLDDGPWQQVRSLLDEVWYLEVPAGERRERLMRRHERHGRGPQEAAAWVAHNDTPNAATVESTRERADLVIHPDATAGDPQGRTSA